MSHSGIHKWTKGQMLPSYGKFEWLYCMVWSSITCHVVGSHSSSRCGRWKETIAVSWMCEAQSETWKKDEKRSFKWNGFLFFAAYLQKRWKIGRIEGLSIGDAWMEPQAEDLRALETPGRLGACAQPLGRGHPFSRGRSGTGTAAHAGRTAGTAEGTET